MLNGACFFSGIAELTIALAPWFETKVYCEIERYPQACLLSRQERMDIPAAPIIEDIRTVSGRAFAGLIDGFYGGFPCQDISCAGDGAGLEGKRSGLFFEIARLIGEARPQWVFLENVPAIRTRGADVVAGRLASLGYDCRWGVLSAFDMGAPHLRERWWLLAHRDSDRREGISQRHRQGSEIRWPLGNHANGFRDALSDADSSDLWDEQRRGSGKGRLGLAEPRDDGEAQSLADSQRSGWSWGTGKEMHGEGWSEFELASGRANVADCDGQRWEGIWQTWKWDRHASFGDWWRLEPDVGRVAHGVPFRRQRIRALGNAVCAATAREAFKRLSGVK